MYLKVPRFRIWAASKEIEKCKLGLERQSVQEGPQDKIALLLINPQERPDPLGGLLEAAVIVVGIVPPTRHTSNVELEDTRRHRPIWQIWQYRRQMWVGVRPVDCGKRESPLDFVHP